MHERRGIRLTGRAFAASDLHADGIREADLATLAPDVSFRDQLDLDSMDHLNFVIALHAALQVEIPEADYPKLATLDACVNYLVAAATADRH